MPALITISTLIYHREMIHLSASPVKQKQKRSDRTHEDFPVSFLFIVSLTGASESPL